MGSGSAGQSYEPFVEEWQLGIEALARRGSFVYSGGVRYSDLDFDYEHPSTVFEGKTRLGGFEATDFVGFFGGVTWEMAPAHSARVRLHVLDEAAVSLGLSYRF